MSSIEQTINDAFEQRADITPSTVDSETKKAIEEAIDLIDSGEARVAEQKGVGDWVVDEWLKNCLLYISPSPRDQRGSRMPSSA